MDHGAGEICLNSIDTDGVRSGFDLEMLDAVAARVNVPIIASGGAGKKEDFLELFHHKGIDAGLAAGIFHQKLLTIRDLKEYLNANGDAAVTPGHFSPARGEAVTRNRISAKTTRKLLRLRTEYAKLVISPSGEGEPL